MDRSNYNWISFHLLLGLIVDNRIEIIKRLKEDLVGPKNGIDEILNERPSERYITGIIFPKRTEIPSEQHEQNDKVNSSSVLDEDDDQESSIYKNFKPATCGISFVIVSDIKQKSLINVKIQCGKYIRETIIDEESKERFIWKRKGTNVSEEIDLNDFRSIHPLEKHDLDAYLFIKVHEINNNKMVTIQFVNNFESVKDTERFEIEEKTIFQFKLTISTNKNATFRPKYLSNFGDDEDSLSSKLIYRETKEYATGHNCSASWSYEKELVKTLSTNWMPKVEVKSVNPNGDEVFDYHVSRTKIGSLSAPRIFNDNDEDVFELLDAFCMAYSKWIDITKIDAQQNLNQDEMKQSKINLSRCEEALQRISEGINFLKNNEKALIAFRISNLVMSVQKSWANGEKNWEKHINSGLIWRPFQLAFALLCLPSTSSRSHKDRDIFDLIWFPTGGGKTEAYLLLSAYVLIFRRLNLDISEASGVAVLMRYTLRTLTVQQFQRAAAMITACEVVRVEKYKSILGDENFSIGLWVGKDSTPNYVNDAISALNDSFSTSTPAQLKNCPICKSRLAWKVNEFNQTIDCICNSDFCKSSKILGKIPALTVDEEIYKNPPSLIIGTVDKFAQIVKNTDTKALFGTNTSKQPPDLIIQDELHLISGPLGSIIGIYEIAIDEFCKNSKGKAKIIGSTATIRRAEDQIRSLFDRRSFQFPPAGIHEKSSGFAAKDENASGRIYIGVSTNGNSPKYVLQLISASLLQSGISDKLSNNSRDFYTTLVSYYNSIKELAGALVLMQDDVPMTISSLAEQRDEIQREIEIPEELTSRKASSEIPEILEQLDLGIKDDGFIDVLLASNMLSVGVDIPRLGLMVINGQPKSMSEYIQASSRVGRTKDGPGLIVSIYNHNKIRDRAHFETFTSWHEALYRSVEPTSVTPFASRARDKALHAPLVAMSRHLLNISKPKMNNHSFNQIKSQVLPVILDRVSSIDPREKKPTSKELEDFLAYWEERNEINFFWNDRYFNKSLLISAEKQASRLAAGKEASPARATPTSVRNVEPSVEFRLKEYYFMEKESNNDGE